MTDKYIVHSIDYVSVVALHEWMNKKVNEIVKDGKKAEFTVKEYKSKRSLPANSLYWQWMGVLSQHFTSKGNPISKDDAHDLMRHCFLGYDEPKKIGNTEIGRRLKSTTKLNTSEFCFYLNQVDAWAVERGCYLPRPEDSEYEKYRESQE